MEHATQDKEWREERERLMREEWSGCVNDGRSSCAPGDEQREERTRGSGGRGSGRGAGKNCLRAEQEREREQGGSRRRRTSGSARA